MIDFLKGTVGKDYFSSACVGWELELNGRFKVKPSSLACSNLTQSLNDSMILQDNNS